MAYNLPAIRIPIRGVDEFSKVMSSVGRQVQHASRNVRQAGRAMTAGLTVPLVGAGIASVMASMQINESMANVATMIPGNVDRVRELKQGVQSLALETGKGTTDIASGLFQVISAFGDSAETLDVLRINSRAAVAGVAGVADSINLTSAVTKAYGDTSAATMQKVVDLAFMTNKLGQTTFPELAASLPRVTALSKQLNVSMEEMFGVMATATGVTGNTAEVSTQLASVLTALIKPSTDMTRAFDVLGVKSGEELIKQRGLRGTMEALIGLTKKYDISLGDLMGRKEALILTYALTGAQADTFGRKLDAMRNVTGAADDAFREQTEGINAAGFAWNQFRRRLEVTGQVLGDRLAPTLTRVLEGLSPLLEKIANMSPETMKWVLAIAAAVAALGPLLLVIGSIGMAVGGIAAATPAILAAVAAVKVLAVALAGAALPVALVVAGFVAWGKAIWELKKGWKDIVDVFSDLDLFIKTVRTFLVDMLGPLAKFIGLGAASAMGVPVGAVGSVARAAGVGGGGGTSRSEVNVRVESDRPGVRAEVLSGNVALETIMGLLPVGE